MSSITLLWKLHIQGSSSPPDIPVPRHINTHTHKHTHTHTHTHTVHRSRRKSQFDFFLAVFYTPEQHNNYFAVKILV